MPRTVTASEAKTRFGSIADWVVEANDDVVVESYGQPKVAIVPYSEYQRMLHLREQARRREALERLRALRDAVRQRNQDLNEQEAEALAQRFASEVVCELMDHDSVDSARGARSDDGSNTSACG